MADITEPTKMHPHHKVRMALATALCTALLAALFAVLTPSPAVAMRPCPDGDTCYPDPPEPPDPSPTTPPLPPSISITGRTDKTVSVSAYFAEYTTSRTLQRRVGTSWIDLVSGSGDGGLTHTDGGLTPDTQYCYRVRAANGYGSSYSTSACTYTSDGRGNPVWRVQLRIMTGDVSDAGTDDDVLASIGGWKNGTGGSTYLDHARDDFERNDVHNYDISTTAIDNLGDIHSIVLSKFGDDDWCVRNVVLLVDNEVAFAGGFGDPCTWIGSDSPTTVVGVTHAELRAYPLWSTFKAPLPPITTNPDTTKHMRLTLPGYELEQRIEALVGHSIHGTDAYWGQLYGRGVEVSPVASDRVHVDLDLAASAFASDPEVDVDFDLVLRTHREANGDWIVDIVMDRLVVDVDLVWWEDLLDYILPCDPVHAAQTDRWRRCFDKLADDGEALVKKQIGEVTKSFNLEGAPSNVTATFDDTAAMNVDVTFGTPKTK